MPNIPYIRGVAEVFGYPPHLETTEAQRARAEYRCPFIGSRCVKQSQHRDHDPNIPFGACSVWHKGDHDEVANPYVICPVRFTEDQRVFADVVKLFTPRSEFSIQMVTELNFRGIGRIDQILTQVDGANGDILDFNVLEIMACSTTSTGYVIKSFNKALMGEEAEGPLRYGINYRQVLSRMAVQALSKVEACEQWGAHMVWAIQDVLYNYMANTTMLDLPSYPLSVLDVLSDDLPALLLFIYHMEDKNRRFRLELSEIRGGTVAEFGQVMRPKRTPTRDTVVARLQAKIESGRSISLTREGIVEIASELMENEPGQPEE